MDRWIRWEGTSARVTGSGHTGAARQPTRARTHGAKRPGCRAPVPRTPHDDGRMTDAAARRPVDGDETRAANRAWWDGEADDYYAEHGAFLGDSELRLGPGGLDRGRARPARGARRHDRARDRRRRRPVLALAGRARATCAVVASDLSMGMLRTARRIEAEHRTPAHGSVPLPLLQCDGLALPFGDATVDRRVHGLRRRALRRGQRRGACAEAARVLRPGGRFVFSTSHPVRWAFPDDPGADGLTATTSYFDRTPVRRERGGGRDLRRAPPHPRRPRAPGRRGRARARRPRRARVAGAQRRGLGRLVARCAARCCRAPRSSSPTARAEGRVRRASGACGTTRWSAAVPPRSAPSCPGRGAPSCASAAAGMGAHPAVEVCLALACRPRSRCRGRARTAGEDEEQAARRARASRGLPRTIGAAGDEVELGVVRLGVLDVRGDRLVREAQLEVEDGRAVVELRTWASVWSMI